MPVPPIDAFAIDDQPERRRQRRSVDTRNRIIGAALKEFAAKGYEGAATRSIAASANVQHTLVTYHFGSKEGLWKATIGHVGELLRHRLEGRLSGLRGVDDATVLYLYLEEFVQFSAEVPEFSWVMANVASHPSQLLDWILENGVRTGFARTADLIRSAQKSGHFVPGEPKYLYYLFIGMVTRIFMLSAEVEAILGVSPFEATFLRRHTETCLRFFFTKPPEAAASTRRVVAE